MSFFRFTDLRIYQNERSAEVIHATDEDDDAESVIIPDISKFSNVSDIIPSNIVNDNTEYVNIFNRKRGGEVQRLKLSDFNWSMVIFLGLPIVKKR